MPATLRCQYLDPAGTAPDGSTHPRCPGPHRRDVADYADAQPVDIILQLFSLLIKLKLQKLPVANLLPQKFLIPFYSLRFSEPDGLLPFHPLFIAEMAFQSHVEGIIVQPVAVFSTECPVLLCLPVTASLIGFFQQRKAVIIDCKPYLTSSSLSNQ